jgi:hypothetical protein
MMLVKNPKFSVDKETDHIDILLKQNLTAIHACPN